MKDRLKKAKANIKHYAPVVVATSCITAIAVLVYTRKSNDEWTGYVLNQDQRDLMAGNSDGVVAFPDQKVFILGQPWNPDK